MKATSTGGRLNTLNDKCSITIPGTDPIELKILPEITDTKKASYNDERVIGRSSPIKTYSHSDSRVITMNLHFMVTTRDDIQENIKALYAIESATYPQRGENGPYKPPPVCKIKCGKMLGKDSELCVVLDTYSVQSPNNVVWDEETLIPYYFIVNTTWHVVYSSDSLPNQEQILN